MLGFLAGYFDGNGSYNKEMCNIRIGTGSQYLAPQLQFLLLRVGINSKVCCEDKTETRVIKGKIANFTGNFYSIEFYKKIDVVKFLKFKEILKVSNQIISLDNLRQSKIEKNIFWVKVKEINKLSPENTYNLEIKDNNTFIVNDIITHNSGRTARLMKGSVYTFLARDTIDEIYYNVAIKKEEKMHKSLETIGHELNSTTPEKSSQINSSKWEEVGTR